MSQPERRHFGGQEKVKILRMHLLEGKPVSDLCKQHKINPSLFYQWQRTFFENGARAFEGCVLAVTTRGQYTDCARILCS